MTFANAKEGWDVVFEKLTRLDAVPKQILIGMEATSRYGENLYVRSDAACVERSKGAPSLVSKAVPNPSRRSLVTVGWKARDNVQGSF